MFVKGILLYSLYLALTASATELWCSKGFLSPSAPPLRANDNNPNGRMCCSKACDATCTFCSSVAPRNLIPSKNASDQNRATSASVLTRNASNSTNTTRRIVHPVCCGFPRRCVNTSDTGCIVANPTAVPIFMNGQERAELFANCTSSLSSPIRPHAVDSLISQKYGFVYVDNVKAGSTTIRNIFKKQLNETFLASAQEVKNASCLHVFGLRNHQRYRTTTQCVTKEEENALFVFSVVRDPVQKFESGVRQYWNQDPFKRRLSADAILQMQLKSPTTWLNEHLEPSTWRLSGITQERSQIRFNYIGALETLESNDWDRITRIINIGVPNNASLSPTLDGHSGTQAYINKRGGSSILTSKGIQLMCASQHYQHEWRCLGYELPLVCRTNATQGLALLNEAS